MSIGYNFKIFLDEMDPKANPPPRGRGAALIEALRKAKQQGETAPGEKSQEPARPTPRGRAATLQKLAEFKQSRSSDVGEEKRTSPSTSITKITDSLTTTSITQSEPCFYRGTSGSQISASCNYIRLVTEGERGVFEYHVQFIPQIDAKSVKGKTINLHLGFIKMYDGGSCLYLPVKLEKPKMEYHCIHPHDNSEFVMVVTFIKQKRLGECLHLFNVLFKKIMRALLYSQIGRNYFDPHHTHMIPQHKLEVLPGYAVAVDEYEGGVMICLDTQHKVMRTQNVYDVLIDLQCMCKERVVENVGKALLGTTVLTRYV